MPTRVEVIANIDETIRDKTISDKINNVEDADNRELIVDYIDQEVATKVSADDLGAVAFSNDYNDLENKPDLDAKQDNLESGTNIKTINGNSILGSGNLDISASLGYLSYAVLISQSGTSSPTVKPLSNNTGVTFTLSRSSTGTYLLVGSSNVFTTDKTATIYSYNSLGSYANGSMLFYSLGAQFFQIETRNSGTLSDGVITDAYIEIRIYN
jgi:hypothetical protein